MRKNVNKWSFLMILIFFLGCDKTGGGGDTDDIYIPDFSNDWLVIKGYNLNDNIFMNPFSSNPISIDSAKGTGVFSGFDDTNGGDVIAVFLTFTNTKVKFTISADSLNSSVAPFADSTYTGIYDTLPNPHLLRLINSVAPHDSLVLRHG